MQSKDDKSKQVKDVNKKPDDVGSVNIQTHVRIFDPNSKEVFVSKRS